MAKLVVNQEKLNKGSIDRLIKLCPFGAIEKKGEELYINSACKMCRLCVKKGPVGAIEFIEDNKNILDKTEWKGIAVYVDHLEGEIHPVTYELIGKAKELAKKIGHPVYCVFIGSDITEKSKELLHYGVDEVIVYDDPELKFFRIEPYTATFEDFINIRRPSVILVGATTIGRSLAPRIAARFKTGITADCTVLDVKENSDLVQIRPAFGGNIMAKIITPNNRPQLATVRYKVMDMPQRNEIPKGVITNRMIKQSLLASDIEVRSVIKKEKTENIVDADYIVALGSAIKDEKQIGLAKTLAELLDAQIASTRPLVECGLVDPRKQIGLSGRTVKPKMIINLGISGAVQFIAGMQNSECIFSINTDKDAPIFNISHYSVVGDIYEVVPRLIEEIKKYKGTDTRKEIMAGV